MPLFNDSGLTNHSVTNQNHKQTECGGEGGGRGGFLFLVSGFWFLISDFSFLISGSWFWSLWFLVSDFSCLISRP